MANSTSLPNTLQGQVYPNTNQLQFPEQANPRYSASEKPIGLCFSGGGPRAMTAGMGQMRGIIATEGVIDTVGAISCVSGGTWFGTLFSYAPNRIDDTTLLGPVVNPTDITVPGLQNVSAECLCYPITMMTNSTIALQVAYLGYQHLWHKLPYDRFWNRFLNDVMFLPFSLSSTSTFFSLDQTTVNNILAKNPELTHSNFYIMRPNRPFLIAGATQIYPTGTSQVMRQFEYTAQYAGTSQEFPGIGPNNQDFGYGYADNLIFNSTTPSAPNSSNFVTVNTPSLPFILSDMAGSSSAALGGAFEQFFKSGLIFPSFDYWPITDIGNESDANYGFDDGGSLENVGIVPILRRQYPVVIAFVNSSNPIGCTSGDCVQGVDSQISRLFGVMPKDTVLNDQDTQVFDNQNGEFDRLATGLAEAKQNKQPVVYSDTYSIKTGNSFGIPPYPNNNEVHVVWVYNDVNAQWVSQLPSDVQNLLTSTDKANYMANFPNYKTVGQNEVEEAGIWIPEALWLSPQQINLLADMCCYTVTNIWDKVNAILEKI
jgi:hypothetical protein